MLFVAGDVRRLSRTPSGTVDIVLEKVLQQLYRDDPNLDPDAARGEIETLGGGLAGPSTSPATLAVEPGNQRVLAILAALRRSGPSARTGRALAHVADEALTESSTSARTLGRPFNAAADSLATLLYAGFSPATTLRATAELAAANPRFGHARDALWAHAAHESVFDDAHALLAGNPALADEPVHQVFDALAPDGSLTASVADLEALVRQDMQTVDAQSTAAIADHNSIARVCPGSDLCQAVIDGARDRGLAARTTIAARQASLTAAGSLLATSDAHFAAAVQEAQAAAQVANAVNSYFAALDYGQFVHAAGDVAGLLTTLGVAEFDPAAAVTGVLNIVGDVVGASIAAPDANALILQGLQGVSQQLAAFSLATAESFRAVDTRLEALTRQVGTQAEQLSAQIADAQTQLSGLGSALSTLQGSVDRLHSEIQLLFSQGARNDLGTIINQSVGYTELNDERLPRTQFAYSAGALFQDATATALTPTVLNVPPAFDAGTASRLGDLDPNVNFFALFPGRVTDSAPGTTWPAPLDDYCPGGDLGRGLCLPDPDFWAAASRAFAQLLLENRDYVTPARLTQLDAALAGGRSLDQAFGRIAAHDAGLRTGSRLFNTALDYYDSWVGTDADRASGAPALLQTLRAERERYLSTVRPAGLESGGPWIDLYGGPDQSLGTVGLFGLGSLNTIPSVRSAFTLPNIRTAPAAIDWLPRPVLNAARLGLGDLTVTWDAQWDPNEPLPGVVLPPALPDSGTLTLRLNFAFVGHPTATRPRGFTDPLGYLQTTHIVVPNCGTTGTAIDADASVVAGWGTRNPRCYDFSPEINQAAADPDPNKGIYVRNASGFDATVADLRPLVEARLRTLQGAALDDALNEDGTLTHGSGSRATDVQAAAERVGGAQALLDGYIELGLPQALATDDTLHALVSGDAANALARPYGDDRRAAPAATVPGQVASFFDLIRQIAPQSDPFVTLALRFAEHRRALEGAITPYIQTGRAPGQSATDGGRLDEHSPLVSATIDRLELTRAVLAAEPAHRHARQQHQPATGRPRNTTQHTRDPSTGQAARTTRPDDPRPARDRSDRLVHGELPDRLLPHHDHASRW